MCADQCQASTHLLHQVSAPNDLVHGLVAQLGQVSPHLRMDEYRQDTWRQSVYVCEVQWACIACT